MDDAGESLFSCKVYGAGVARVLCVHMKYTRDNNASMRSSAFEVSRERAS